MLKKNNSNIDVTIVMPCLNEVGSLGHCIEAAKAALEELATHNLVGEVLISDNGSTDGSQALAEERGCRVVHCPRKGYGNALIFGLQAALGKYLVMGDSDASYDFKESVPMVLKLHEGYELCMGSRFKGKILPGAMPWKNKYIGNPALSGILNLFFRSGLSDAHCGLRALTKDAFNRMELSSPGMEFASEMVVKATLKDLRRTEVPITLSPDKRGRPPHLRPWQDGWRHLKFLVMYGPLWMFFTPAFTMILVSSVIIGAVFLAPERGTFGVGSLKFGDHWLALSSGGMLIGYQAFLLGLVALCYRAYQAVFPSTSKSHTIYSKVTLENTIILGSLLFIIGGTIITYVVIGWGKEGFGGLYRIREIILATTFIVMGVQTYFTGLLISIVGHEHNKNGPFRESGTS